MSSKDLGSGFTVEQNVMVAMRDGVRLATDVYRPMVDGRVIKRRLPVIMERTPYGKRRVNRSERSSEQQEAAVRPEVAAFFAREGFVVVMQDCRGRYGSEGSFTKYVNEAEDGFDTMAWLLEQAWCDGTVGTMGVSYGAHTQCALASLNPPGLACMFMDSGGFANAYQGGIRRGGAFELKQATWAYKHALLSPATLADASRAEALRHTDIVEWFRDMPWEPGHSPLSAAPEYEAYLFEQWRAGTFTDYWRQPGLYAEGYYDRFPDVPTAIVGSWYDPYVGSCTGNFTELARRKQSPVTLLMGPWTHGDRSVSYAGDVDFGPDAIMDGNVAADYLRLRLSWFNRYLRAYADENESATTSVTYFQMGGGDGRRLESGRLRHGGRWRRSAQWPPQNVVMSTLFFGADGNLSTKPDRDGTMFLQYRFDPKDPVPTIGGALTSGQPVMQGGAFDQRTNPDVFKYKVDVEDGALADRQDVLVFVTPELEQDLIVTGVPQVDLWVSTDCPDTDFTVKLIDWYPPSDDYPQGYAMNITDGIFRLRYREGWDREIFAAAGEVYKIRIEPFATSNLFQKGHRLRIDISSSNYPHFDINPNTASPVGYASSAVIAENRVWCCAKYPSQIRLPIAQTGGAEHAS